VAGDPAIDPRAALAALGVTNPDDVASVDGGWDASIWRVEHGGLVSALRVFRPEQALTAQHEVRIMTLAADAAPAIRVEGILEQCPLLLLEWCPGRTVAAELKARPWQARRLGIAFGEAQARVHATPIGHELVDLAGRWLIIAGPTENALRRRLRAVVTPDCLLHLDFHPLNVMIDGDRVSGVLDWSNALPGDRRADLARTFSILRLMSGVPDGLRPWERIVLRIFERGWWTGYRRHSGPVTDMPIFYVWAGAVMQRDLAPRVGRPDTGLTPKHMDTIRAWTNGWRRKTRLGVE
jgi:aminoglycoside phosphotransferase (APT) family kinase protein